MTEEQKLINITFVLKKHLKEEKIITPLIYQKEFLKEAKKKKLFLNENEKIINIFNKEYEKIEKSYGHINKTIFKIKEETNNAKKAIEKKDQLVLDKVLNKINLMETDLHKLQNELYTDELTKSKNKRWLNENYLIDNTFKTNGCLYLFNINNFQKINEEFGYIVGDKILLYFNNFLKKYFNTENIKIVRYFADKFILIIENENISKTENKVLELKEEISNKKLKTRNDIVFSISFSYGKSNFFIKENINSVLEIANNSLK